MEITKNNFLEELERIAVDLHNSCYVGFDAEFTAILTGDSHKHRMFDNNESRYHKLKNEVSNIIMTQVGLTMFSYDRSLESYTAINYTFHLCPQAFGDIDQSLIFQASTLDFLRTHKFDFNKFLYEGLPFLSRAEEAEVRSDMKNGTILKKLIKSLTIEQEKALESYYPTISKWLKRNEEDTMYLDIENPIIRYIAHHEVRTRYPLVLTTNSLGNGNKILIFRNKDVENACNVPVTALNEELINHILGFSRVIYLLEASKKPIVGHNVHMDVVLLHKQFLGPLPNKYSEFKKSFHILFPNFYDTKHISNQVSKKLKFDEVWKTNTLQGLYEFFAEGKCKRLQKGVNFIRISRPFDTNQTYHEAGYDSYCAGYCLIRLGHWMACENSGHPRPVGPTELFSALKPFANKVNVIRGAIPYMNLVGDDPPSHRPALLHIKRIAWRAINFEEMSSNLAECGIIDIERYGRRAFLIAPNARITVDRIMKRFENSREYKVSTYSVYKHSMAARLAMWSGAVFTGSIMLYMFRNKVFLKCLQ